MKKHKEIVTVLVATYNSEKLLPKVLDAIRVQSYPQELIEILVVDGGSSDNTREIAKDYGCIVIDNPKTEPVYAKLLGIKHAKGKYLLTVDHDEVFENMDSIETRVRVLRENPECKVAFCSGYKRPDNYPLLNQYISEFGDPFSLFIYNFSKDWKFYEKVLRRNYKVVKETEEYLMVSFEKMTKSPLVELICLGTMIDLEFFKKETNIENDSTELVHLFYLMINKGIYTTILTKNDPLVHYSVDSLKAYLPKLRWRVCNNVHFQEKGEKGFSGREAFQKNLKYKKYLFIPYAFIVPISFVHSLYLAFTRKNSIYLLHPILALYVAIQILYQMVLKILHITPDFTSYDGKKKIER